MSGLVDFLVANRERLGLERYGLADSAGFLLLTPRFAASRHVVFLVIDEQSRAPTLVAKIPRLRGDAGGIERESTILRTLEHRPSGAGSVPRVLALEDYFGHGLLLETALIGRPIDTAFVRRSPTSAIEPVVTWLTTLRVPEPGPRETASDAFERLVEQPLLLFAQRFEGTDLELRLVEETLEVARPLSDNIPEVIEHGDVSHPNLLWLANGQVGIIDWELAEPRGLPLYDLSFFLAYVASALARAQTTSERVNAFHGAFTGPVPWARPYTESYCRMLELDRSLVPALLIACWARYAANVLSRSDGLACSESASGRWSGAQKTALRAHPHYGLWRHALSHKHELAALVPT
jgi:hypothetical protein